MSPFQGFILNQKLELPLLLTPYKLDRRQAGEAQCGAKTHASPCSAERCTLKDEQRPTHSILESTKSIFSADFSLFVAYVLINVGYEY